MTLKLLSKVTFLILGFSLSAQKALSSMSYEYGGVKYNLQQQGFWINQNFTEWTSKLNDNVNLGIASNKQEINISDCGNQCLEIKVTDSFFFIRASTKNTLEVTFKPEAIYWKTNGKFFFIAAGDSSNNSGAVPVSQLNGDHLKKFLDYITAGNLDQPFRF